MLKIIHILILKKEVNDRVTKFKVDDHVRVLKYKNIFVKGCTPNCSDEIFITKNTTVLKYCLKIIL